MRFLFSKVPGRRRVTLGVRLIRHTGKPMNYFEALSKHVDDVFTRFAQLGFAGLTTAEQTFLCVWSLKGEVDNGGFDQFFFNSSGDYACHTPDALRRIHADEVALIVERGLGLFPDSRPAEDRDIRIEQLDGLSEAAKEQLSDLDSDFGRESESLDRLLSEYVEQYQSEFIRVS